MSEKQTNGCDPGLRGALRSGGIQRCFAAAFSLGTFISLVISLAANNSIVLPETSALENISVNINILGGNFLQRSVNIFGGIFVALSIIGIIHCVVWLVLHFLNIGYINNKWSCFGRISLAFDSILMFAQAGCIAGAYFIASLLGAHALLDPNHDPALGMVHTGLWVAFGFSNGCIGQHFGLVIITCFSLYWGNNKCDKKKCGGGENQLVDNEKPDLNLH